MQCTVYDQGKDGPKEGRAKMRTRSPHITNRIPSLYEYSEELTITLDRLVSGAYSISRLEETEGQKEGLARIARVTPRRDKSVGLTAYEVLPLRKARAQPDERIHTNIYSFEIRNLNSSGCPSREEEDEGSNSSSIGSLKGSS
ncbi:hypothetical protein COLO4_00247 [Corchorus olitorius]|uniref:Uncharacterized protein n=1 Tax=Corchorus olitorius TaxID=93759 RepID=A0A1R3L490_9ROSI|nr:hypothetical protein COLO4_00247 [Corchorus olitorius]